MPYCKECGKKLEAKAKFCSHCGAGVSVKAMKAPEEPKARLKGPQKIGIPIIAVIAIVAAVIAVVATGAYLLTRKKELFEDFSTAVFASGNWTRSDASVSVDTTNGWLIISANQKFDDYAEKIVSFSLPIVAESRMKLESGGFNYRLPWLGLYYGPTNNDVVSITYLPGSTYGWSFNGWTFIDTKAPSGVGIWITVKAIIRSDGGELLAKWDTDTTFTSITTRNWSIPNTITKIRYSQPWDSVCYIDYISVSPL